MSKVSKTKRVLLATLAACTIAVVGLLGCSGAAEVNSAEEVYEHYSQTAHDNYKMDGTFEMDVSAQGMSMNIPMEIHLETADKAAHSTTSTEMFGMSQETETYIVPEGNGYVMYMGIPDMSTTDSAEKSWTKSTTDDMTNSMESMAKLEKTMFEGADFAKITDGYSVTIPFSKMIAAMNDTSANSDELSSMMQQMESMGVSLDNIKVTYNFDKECHLTKILIEKTEIPYEAQGQKGSIAIACNLALTDYGKVAPITVPEDVIKAATDMGAVDSMSMFEDAEESAASASATSNTKADEVGTAGATEAANAAAEGAKAGADTAANANSAAAESAKDSIDAASKSTASADNK